MGRKQPSEGNPRSRVSNLRSVCQDGRSVFELNFLPFQPVVVPAADQWPQQLQQASPAQASMVVTSDQQQQSQMQMPAAGGSQYWMVPPTMGQAATETMAMPTGQHIILWAWTTQGFMPVSLEVQQPVAAVSQLEIDQQQSTMNPEVRSAVAVPSSARQSVRTASRSRRSGTASTREQAATRTAMVGNEERPPTEGGDTYENLPTA